MTVAAALSSAARKLGIRKSVAVAKSAAPVAKSPRTVSFGRVVKADDTKRIAFGVVLDPYIIDLQNDWVPPDEVASACHQWSSKWRMVGSQHDRRSENSVVVESAVLPYPSLADYDAACALQSHRIYEMPWGSDVLHSGAWYMGVYVPDDAEWSKVLSGEYDGFSIRGFGERIPVSPRIMPEVTIIDLGSILGTGTSTGTDARDATRAAAAAASASASTAKGAT